MSHTHRSPTPWDRNRPSALVVACSDGRLQENVDEFLEKSLGITHYDRMYVPGGPGALIGTEEVTRSHNFRRECRNLVALHGIKHVVLLFHSPAAEGPEEACCGDYRRRLSGQSIASVRARQERDASELVSGGMGEGVKISAYRCEVCNNDAIVFVALAIGEQP